jgi:hypothetical protein
LTGSPTVLFSCLFCRGGFRFVAPLDLDGQPLISKFYNSIHFTVIVVTPVQKRGRAKNAQTSVYSPIIAGNGIEKKKAKND